MLLTDKDATKCLFSKCRWTHVMFHISDWAGTIGADSTGAAGKMPRYMRHNWGKSIILPGYYFSQATISTLLSYTKMVKTAAVRSFHKEKFTKMLLWPGLCPGSHWVYQTPSRPGRETHRSHSPPSLTPSSSQFQHLWHLDSTIGSRHAALVLITKSAPMAGTMKLNRSKYMLWQALLQQIGTSRVRPL